MQKLINFFQYCHQFTFTRFAFVGAISAVVYFLMFHFFWQWLHLPYLMAITFAYFFSVLCHFLLNRQYSFNAKQFDVSLQLFRYLCMLLINYCITLIISYCVVSYYHYSPYFAMMLAICITMMLSFTLSKRWVFSHDHYA